MYIELSEVDSDEAINLERSKKSRFTRCINEKGRQSPTKECSKKVVKQPIPSSSRDFPPSEEFQNSEENENNSNSVDVEKTNSQDFPSRKDQGQKRKSDQYHDTEEVVIDEQLEGGGILTENDSSDNVLTLGEC